MTWEGRKRWADRFLPEMSRIIGEHLIVEAPLEEDRNRNTDLIVLRLEAVRIACRVRRFGYLQRCGDEFTIRTANPSGARTELDKVMDGWGDFMLYGFCDPTETHLQRWTLIDLSVFRRWVAEHLFQTNGRLPGTPFGNDDGTRFRAFRYADCPYCSSLIVADHIGKDGNEDSGVRPVFDRHRFL